MALQANGYRLGYFPCKVVGALTTIYNGQGLRDFHLTGRRRCLTASEGITSDLPGIPDGYNHPGAWLIPMKPGNLSSHRRAIGSCMVSASITEGRNISGLAEGTSTATATLQLVVSMSGLAAGTSTVTGNLLAALMLSGLAEGSCVVSGNIGALAWCSGEADGTSTATATIYATGRLFGSITPYTELSPENLANAVLNSPIDGTDTLSSSIKVIRGLNHENFLMKDQVFDGSDRLVSATVRIFANSSDCASDTNCIEEYELTSTYGTSGKFRMVRV